MFDDWRNAKREQGFQERTMNRRHVCVERFIDLSGKYAWEWTQVNAEDFFAELRGIQHRSSATLRGDPWRAVHADRAALDRASAEGRESPVMRPFSTTELQAFFDLADDEVEWILRSGLRGGLAAYRDAVAFKAKFARGLRRREFCRLQIVDFSRNIRVPRFGAWGVVRVRYANVMRGSPSKQRTVRSGSNADSPGSRTTTAGPSPPNDLLCSTRVRWFAGRSSRSQCSSCRAA